MSKPIIDYRHLFENCPGLYLVLAPDLTILAVSNQYLKATMTTSEGIVGKGLFEVFPDNPDGVKADGVSNLRSSLHNVQTKLIPDIMAVQKYDVRRPESEGGEFEVRYWSPINSPVLDANGKLMMIIHRVEDVTEYIKQKKEGEQNLRLHETLKSRAGQMEAEIYQNAQELQRLNKGLIASRNELDCFFSVALDMLCIAGSDGHFKRVNPAFEMTLGYTAEEMTRTPYLDFIHPDDIEKTKMAVINQLESGQKILSFENRYRHKDGSYRLLSWKSVPVGSCMYAGARDITEEAECKRQIQKLNSELESFSYTVSHDLRAPVRSVVGFSNILQDEYAECLDAEAQDLLARIKRAADKMGLLVDGLLNLAKLNRVAIIKRPVNISNILKEVAAELQSLQQDRSINFIIPDGVEAEGDPVLLRAALSNLMENACKFSSKKEHARIEFGMQNRNRKLCFYLRDNGVGFDMRHIGKLFGTFQRLHAEQEFPGTGIGLASVKRIIERHGGEIWAESKPNEGSIFYFSL